MKPELIAVDWGTTSLRAYLVAGDGRILDRRASASGILAVPREDFESVLAALIAGWRQPDDDVPVTMSGMIGSRQGWVEVPYRDCPAETADIAQGLMHFDTETLGPLVVIPGLETSDLSGIPDVMRGEETQVIGAMLQSGRRTGLYVLPGTHSKWVTVSGGVITGFRTYMTGEIFAALRHHTILARLAEGDQPAPQAFAWGVKTGAEDGGPGALLSRAFSARSRALAGDLPGNGVSEYISGLLIGAELATAGLGPGSFTIIAGDALQARYAEAAGILGLEYRTASGDCVATGHLELARLSGITAGAS